MTLLHDPDLTVAPPQLAGIDHLEWWVGNARAFASDKTVNTLKTSRSRHAFALSNSSYDTRH